MRHHCHAHFNDSFFIFIALSKKFLQELLGGPLLKRKCFIDQGSSIPPLCLRDIQHSELDWKNADETCLAAGGAPNSKLGVILLKDVQKPVAVTALCKLLKTNSAKAVSTVGGCRVTEKFDF